MSVRTAGVEGVEATGRRLLRAVLGDRTGLALFLGSVTLVATWWRVGVLVTDTYALANGLVALADGHLHVERLPYGPPGGATPGLHVAGGRLYARNYGQLVLSLPALHALRATARVASVRVALVGAWCLSLLATVRLAGGAVGRERAATLAGGVAVAVLFVGNLAVARPLDPRWLPLLALQATTALATGLLVVLVYRLCAAIHGRRVGVAAGAGALLATPVGFWATVPKRHALVALLAVGTCYALVRSRGAATRRRATGFRLLAYAAVGLTAWTNAADAAALGAALVPVDLATAERNDPRTLALVAGTLGLSLVPALATNALVAGDPFTPPNLLPGHRGTRVPVVDGVVQPTGGTGETGTAAGGGGGGGTPAGSGGGAGEATGGAPGVLAAGAGLVADAVRRVAAEPGRLLTVLVRWGYTNGPGTGVDGARNLALLQSAPVLAALVAAPAVAWRGLARGGGERPSASRAVRAADRFAVGYALVLGGLYLGRLPVHHQYTVRYLHPIYPLGVYLLVRLPAVRTAVEGAPRTLAASFAGTVGVGVPLYVGALAATGAVQSAAVQLFGLAVLPVAALAGAWSLAAARAGPEAFPGRARDGAAVLGVAAGAAATYLLVSGFVTFAFTDEFLLPLSRLVADAVRAASPFRFLL